MMPQLYDDKALKSIIFITRNDVLDLEKWSVYNQDKGLDSIIELKQKLEAIKKELIHEP